MLRILQCTYIYCRGPGGSSGDSSQEMLARVLSTLLNELDGIGGGGGGGDDSSGRCSMMRLYCKQDLMYSVRSVIFLNICAYWVICVCSSFGL